MPRILYQQRYTHVSRSINETYGKESTPKIFSVKNVPFLF